MKALTRTDFHFDGQKSVYHGKVRDVYYINDDIIVMVATDRISAFDVVLPKGIPFKGQVLNQIAAKFLDHTSDICPNWKLATPDPMVTVGLKCEGFRVEMIIRSILTGSASSHPLYAFCYQAIFFGTAPKVSLSESHSHGYLQKGGNYTGYVLLALYGYLCPVRRYP